MAILTVAAAREARAGDILLFAAASTTNAVEEVVGLYQASGSPRKTAPGRVRVSFAASSSLARQIERGAGAHLFLSASPAWMDHLEKRGLIAPGTRAILFANRLVLIAPKDSRWTIDIAPGFALADQLGAGRLVIADPDHVPAGMYAMAALKALGAWNRVGPRAARAANVRAALALVERGAAPAGIVYATDAAISKRVRIVGTFPNETHPPIAYVSSLIAGLDSPESRRFHRFLSSPQAGAVYRRHGFALD